MQASAREEFFAQVEAKRQEALGALHSGFEEKFGHARELLGEIARQSEALRAESSNAEEANSRVARALLQFEAADAARTTRSPEPSKEEIAGRESAAAEWRQRLESEMTVAQGQWNELLQSSLDNNLQRMVEQLSERSQEALRNAEQKMTERLGELGQPFAQAAAEARETFSGIQSALEQEVLKARSSLAEVKQVASRTGGIFGATGSREPRHGERAAPAAGKNSGRADGGNESAHGKSGGGHFAAGGSGAGFAEPPVPGARRGGGRGEACAASGARSRAVARTGGARSAAGR